MSVEDKVTGAEEHVDIEMTAACARERHLPKCNGCLTAVYPATSQETRASGELAARPKDAPPSMEARRQAAHESTHARLDSSTCALAATRQVPDTWPRHRRHAIKNNTLGYTFTSGENDTTDNQLASFGTRMKGPKSCFFHLLFPRARHAKTTVVHQQQQQGQRQ